MIDGGARSVFHFDVQGAVAKSSHAGVSRLRFIRISDEFQHTFGIVSCTK